MHGSRYYWQSPFSIDGKSMIPTLAEFYYTAVSRRGKIATRNKLVTTLRSQAAFDVAPTHKSISDQEIQAPFNKNRANVGAATVSGRNMSQKLKLHSRLQTQRSLQTLMEAKN